MQCHCACNAELNYGNMNTLTILDFEDGRVYQYQNLTDYEINNVESFMEDYGHNEKNCEWMTHADPDIKTIKL